MHMLSFYRQCDETCLQNYFVHQSTLLNTRSNMNTRANILMTNSDKMDGVKACFLSFLIHFSLFLYLFFIRVVAKMAKWFWIPYRLYVLNLSITSA